jgi:hypothetical protein
VFVSGLGVAVGGTGVAVGGIGVTVGVAVGCPITVNVALPLNIGVVPEPTAVTRTR